MCSRAVQRLQPFLCECQRRPPWRLHQRKGHKLAVFGSRPLPHDKANSGHCYSLICAGAQPSNSGSRHRGYATQYVSSNMLMTGLSHSNPSLQCRQKLCTGAFWGCCGMYRGSTWDVQGSLRHTHGFNMECQGGHHGKEGGGEGVRQDV